jgi:L-2,4-diaminobutyrate transaminase
MTGLPVFHQAFDLPMDRIKHAATPHFYWNAEAGESERDFSRRLARELDAQIEAEGPETVAAFIGEPVLGTGGIVPPPEGYWPEIQQVLDKHDVLLIADEVVCGFGRTGSYYGSVHYGMKPDLVTIAKGLTSGYVPLSGAMIGEKVWTVLKEGSDQFGPFSHGYTYSAHPIGAAAALANLDIVDGEDLTGNARDTGGYLQQRLHETFDSHPLVGEVRGVGLLGALEFVADPSVKRRFDPAHKVGAKVAAACLERGLIARALPHGDILGFAPPLSITRAEVDQVVDTAKAALDAVTDQLTRDGVLQAA